MTDLFGRFILSVAVVAMLVAAVRTAVAGGDDITPREAIERAVAQRIGGNVSVDVTSLDTAVAAERGLSALPEPGGHAGAPMRFVLMAGRVRRGVAIATVRISGSYARAARAIARNDTIAADAVEVVEGELPPAGLKRLPAGDEVVGLIARRDIAAGEALTSTVLQIPPTVRAGDALDLTVIVGTVRVNAKATASASGFQGEIIRVTPEGGKPLKARITGRGKVEVVQ